MIFFYSRKIYFVWKLFRKSPRALKNVRKLSKTAKNTKEITKNIRAKSKQFRLISNFPKSIFRIVPNKKGCSDWMRKLMSMFVNLIRKHLFKVGHVKVWKGAPFFPFLVKLVVEPKWIYKVGKSEAFPSFEALDTLKLTFFHQ